MAKEKISVYEIITNKIIDQLDKGVVPWKKTWKGSMYEPKNIRGTGYRGVNRLLLAFSEYDSPYWMTYKQAQGLGGQVRKGEKATPVTFWSFIEKEVTKNGETKKKKIGFLRYYSCFNLEQIDGIPEEKLKKFEIVPEHDHDSIKEAEEIIASYKDIPEIKKGKPSYRPMEDTIQMPDINSFETSENYYSVLFHEANHSTGSEKKLNRDGIVKFDGFSTEQYSKEELVAEIGACFLNSHCGIEAENFDNNLAYLQNWKSKLEDNPKLIISASSQAQKSVDYILGIENDYEKK